MDRKAALREEILALVAEYHAEAFPARPFVGGETAVPVSGRVFDATDMQYLVDASLDFWLTAGRFAEQFEREFAQYLGVRHAMLCNSGSSANLLALSALTSSKLGERRLQAGDEIITAAAGFPTTVNPIVQNGLMPVFVDIDLRTHNIDVSQIEAAISPKTKGIMVAHTLGNPFEVDVVMAIAERHGLWVIEDNCDALGSIYKGKLTGTFGDLATSSFYPAHHITMGEGGCVVTNKPALKKLVESFRDWGRDCWCAPGVDNTCGKRFGWQLGELPDGYDHKYTYSHIGYNLKLTDMQAAVGVAQLQKLQKFVAVRRKNWRALRDGLRDLEDFFVLPEATADSEPSWFGFLLMLRENAPFGRGDLIRHLEAQGIATRLLFGGNLIRQPAYRGVQYRQVGDLAQTNVAMNQSFWIGLYPGVTDEMVGFVLDETHHFCQALQTQVK